jgi:hypothetical protein
VPFFLVNNVRPKKSSIKNPEWFYIKRCQIFLLALTTANTKAPTATPAKPSNKVLSAQPADGKTW